jgi:hypothetical protein
MKLPAEVRSAVVLSPPDPGAGVVICAPPREPNIAGIRAAMRERGLIASMTFDPGVRWPNAIGVATVENVLASGGLVVWEFDRLADALAAQLRLRAVVEGRA